MRVAAFRHVPFEGLGTIDPALVRYGHFIQYYNSFEFGTSPRVEDPDAFVFMGRPMSVNDPVPFLDTEIGLIQEAAEAGRPVLGICLGAQLVAKAMGAR